MQRLFFPQLGTEQHLLVFRASLSFGFYIDLHVCLSLVNNRCVGLEAALNDQCMTSKCHESDSKACGSLCSLMTLSLRSTASSFQLHAFLKQNILKIDLNISHSFFFLQTYFAKMSLQIFYTT